MSLESIFNAAINNDCDNCDIDLAQCVNLGYCQNCDLEKDK